MDLQRILRTAVLIVPLSMLFSGAANSQQAPSDAERIEAMAKIAMMLALAHERTWTDSTGKYQTKATIVDVSNGHVELKRADGTLILVPLERLSDADRKLIAAASDRAKAPAVKPSDLRFKADVSLEELSKAPHIGGPSAEDRYFYNLHASMKTGTYVLNPTYKTVTFTIVSRTLNSASISEKQLFTVIPPRTGGELTVAGRPLIADKLRFKARTAKGDGPETESNWHLTDFGHMIEATQTINQRIENPSPQIPKRSNRSKYSKAMGDGLNGGLNASVNKTEGRQLLVVKIMSDALPKADQADEYNIYLAQRRARSEGNGHASFERLIFGGAAVVGGLVLAGAGGNIAPGLGHLADNMKKSVHRAAPVEEVVRRRLPASVVGAAELAYMKNGSTNHQQELIKL